MAYNFKKNKFNAIQRDKETLYTNNSKISKSNAAFGTLSVNEIMSVAMTDNSLVELIDVDLIKPRNVNDFSKASVETLKESIKELGLFFPILVRTSDNGKYTIISGHRRFAAWTKLHNNKQPIKCIIVDAAKFKTDADVKNYVLMANAQRDSSKDPLLLVKRYKEHEKYLENVLKSLSRG